MDRRGLLIHTGTVLGLVLSGCLQDTPSNTDTETPPGSDNPNNTTDPNNRPPNDFTNSSTVVTNPLVDTPPHPITPPPNPPTQDEWNAHYLGEQMATTPSLEFDSRSARSGIIHDAGLTGFDGEAYWATVIETEPERDALLTHAAATDDTREWLSQINFTDSILIVVESGFGSGSVKHHWARVEETATGVHLHGYYTDPYIQTSDVTSRVSFLRVERPDVPNPVAQVSLTVDSDRRVYFTSDGSDEH